MFHVLLGGLLLVFALAIFYDLVLHNTAWRMVEAVALAGIGVASGFTGLLLLFPRLGELLPKPSPKTCKICSQPARDIFIINGGKQEGTYCRCHIMEKFERAFRSCSFQMVVFHPEQERKHCGTMYPYFAIDAMVSQFDFEKKAVENVRRILGLVKGKCQDCHDKAASVAYYAKGELRWDGSGPVLDNVTSMPKLLCPDCTLKVISPALSANKEFYADNGLFAPHRQSGVYVNTYL